MTPSATPENYTTLTDVTPPRAPGLSLGGVRLVLSSLT